MWVAVIVACLMILAGLFGFAIGQASAQAETREQKLAQQVKKLQHQNKGLRNRVVDADRRGFRRARRQIVNTPDAHFALRLAGAAYGQSWRAMLRCWLSEGYGESRRYDRHIPVTNRQGSGASGPAQFMPGTWRSTPFGQFDIFNVQAAALGTAWMWANGRRGEWSGRGC